MRDLGGRALRVHVSHEDLRPTRIAFGEVREPRPVGRPHGARAFAEHAIVRAVGIHDPERRIPPVVDLVDVPARVDDLLAVGRNLGISNLLEVEVVIDGQKRVGPLLLRAGEAGTGEREQQRDVKGERGASHRLS